MIRQRSFYHNVFALALPMLMQQMLNFLTQMLDPLMTGRLGETAVAAVTVASQPYFIYSTLMIGLTAGGQILISQYWGKKDLAMIRKTMTLMIWSVAAASLAAILMCTLFGTTILHFFSNDTALIAEGVKYLHIVVFAYMLNGLATCYYASLAAKENVSYSTAVYTISFFINLAANWIFMFGAGPVPAMGVAGAAIGTICARGFELIMALIYSESREREIGFSFRDLLHPDRTMLPHFLKICIPVGLDDLVWALATSTQMSVIGHISTAFVTAAGIANLAQNFAMTFVYSVSKSEIVLVGRSIGEGNREKTLQIGRTFLVMSLMVGAFASLVALGVREPLLMLYPGISEQTALLTRSLINVIAILAFLQSIEATCIVGVMRGAGDNHYALLADFLSMWAVGIPSGLAAGFVLHLPSPLVYLCMRADLVVKIPVVVRHILNGNYIHDVAVEYGKD